MELDQKKAAYPDKKGVSIFFNHNYVVLVPLYHILKVASPRCLASRAKHCGATYHRNNMSFWKIIITKNILRFIS